MIEQVWSGIPPFSPKPCFLLSGISSLRWLLVEVYKLRFMNSKCLILVLLDFSCGWKRRDVSRGFLDEREREWNEKSKKNAPLKEIKSWPRGIIRTNIRSVLFIRTNIRSVLFIWTVCTGVHFVQWLTPPLANYTANSMASIIYTVRRLDRIMPSCSVFVLVVSFDLRSLWNLLGTYWTLQYQS